MSVTSTRGSERGVSLIDLLVWIGLFTILAGMAVPMLANVQDAIRLGQSAREVERELQAARLKAVSSNRPIRIRFNCPSAGQYRIVELIGTPSAPDAANTAANRCSGTTYPYPASDTNPLTQPNHDGPVRSLAMNVSFGAAPTLEFWPDGSVHANTTGSDPWPVLSVDGTAITLVKRTEVKTITVNGLGKIQLQP